MKNLKEQITKHTIGETISIEVISYNGKRSGVRLLQQAEKLVALGFLEKKSVRTETVVHQISRLFGRVGGSKTSTSVITTFEIKKQGNNFMENKKELAKKLGVKEEDILATGLAMTMKEINKRKIELADALVALLDHDINGGEAFYDIINQYHELNAEIKRRRGEL